MNYQRNTILILISIVTVLTISSTTGFETNSVFAVEIENLSPLAQYYHELTQPETQSNPTVEEDVGYKIAEDVKTVLTFTFRDGIEVHEFPVFVMTSDFVDNRETTFQVKGVVNEAPHLHKALDEAFKYRLMMSSTNASFDFDYRFFDIDVDFTRDGESIRLLPYSNCEIQDYHVETLNSHDYESYLSSKSGFAIVDTIEFRCGGVNTQNGNGSTDNISGSSTFDVVYDYGELSYKYAEDVRTFVTFQFDRGVEKIEFPVFEITSGFGENDDRPDFKVEGIVGDYPLLHNAIDKARKLSSIASAYNTDFDATVEFVNGEKVLRAIDYTGCIVDSSKITTQYDKEEGFTGKRGFAYVEQTEFTCSGMSPQNPGFDVLYDGTSIMRTSLITHEQMQNGYNMGTGPHAIATFKFNHAIETINFPMFEQSGVLSRSYPTFELEGIVGDYPLLYKRVDQAAKINQVSGVTNSHELFDVDVNLMYDDMAVRGFSYADCRVTDYVVKTQTNKEETYFKGHALSNTFNFECHGYHPYDPIYNAMFENNYEATTISSLDLRVTQVWSDIYKYYQ